MTRSRKMENGDGRKLNRGIVLPKNLSKGQVSIISKGLFE